MSGGDLYCDRRLSEALILSGIIQAFDIPASAIWIGPEYGWIGVPTAPEDGFELFCFYREHGDGDFFFHLDITVRTADSPHAYVDRRRLSRFCAAAGCRGLTSDESPNPYQWLLADETGALWVVNLYAYALDDLDSPAMIIHPEGTTRIGGLLFHHPHAPDQLAEVFAGALAMPRSAVGINLNYPWPADIVMNLDLYPSRDPNFPIGVAVAHRTPVPWKPDREAAEDWVRLARYVCQWLGCAATVGHAGLSQWIRTPTGSAYENELVTITAAGRVERGIFSCSVAWLPRPPAPQG
ncbi:MAG TPA: hypothetical protein VGE07_11570 [Herpetosiphonaceae bacterium]